MNDKQLLNLKNARVKEQLDQMIDLQKKKMCPFCREHFEENHREPILREGKYWLVTKNDYPYEGTKNHVLLVYKKHVSSLEEVSDESMVELLHHFKWVRKKLKLVGGTFALRFGDIHYNGATITHLHAHIISGVRQQKEKTESLRMKVGYKKVTL
jgi:ATP adenylyltransferase